MGICEFQFNAPLSLSGPMFNWGYLMGHLYVAFVGDKRHRKNSVPELNGMAHRMRRVKHGYMDWIKF